MLGTLVPIDTLKFTLVTSVTLSCLIAEVICVRFSAGGAARALLLPWCRHPLACSDLLSAAAGLSPDLLSAAAGLVSPDFAAGFNSPLESPPWSRGASVSGDFVSALSCVRCGAVLGPDFSCAWVGEAGEGVLSGTVGPDFGAAEPGDDCGAEGADAGGAADSPLGAGAP